MVGKSMSEDLIFYGLIGIAGLLMGIWDELRKLRRHFVPDPETRRERRRRERLQRQEPTL